MVSPRSPSDMNEVTLTPTLNHMHTFSKKDFVLEGDLQKRHCNRLMDLCIAVRFDAIVLKTVIIFYGFLFFLVDGEILIIAISVHAMLFLRSSF